MAEETKTENVPVTSTTNDIPPEEQAPVEEAPLDKKEIRNKVLRKMRKDKTTSSSSFQIPFFVDIDKATELLAGTDEFKTAQNIKINFDRPQKGVFLEALKANKNIFLSADRKSTALLDKVENGELRGESEEINEKAVTDIFKSKNHKQEVPLTDKIELDMLVIGSLAVSKNGHRIGNENGFNDLELGILTNLGTITDKTIIVTTVHDDQIVDDLGDDLFKNFDYPLDMIVTPTQVIKVEKRLSRPTGIYWDLLNERRVEASPTLKQLYTEEINAGKTITLKPIDEGRKDGGYRKRRPNLGVGRRMPNFRRFNRPRYNNSIPHRVQENGEVQENKNSRNIITKHFLRKNVWRYIADNKLAELKIFRKIPFFNDYAKATEVLSTLDEYKAAVNILMTNDRVFQNVKLLALNSRSKNIYIPCYTGEDVLSKIKPLEEGTEATLEYLDTILSEKRFDLINMNDKVELDLVILGSVLVSQNGQRISVGNRICDLHIGYLIELGFITPKTKFITLVHGCQIQEIPNDVMAVYDIPIDIIVTPNEIIKIEKPPSRPKGIYWNEVYETQLENSTVLKILKERREASGEIIQIKPPAPRRVPFNRVFTNDRRRRSRFGNNRRIKRNTQNSEVSDSESRSLPPRRNNARVFSRRRQFVPRVDKIANDLPNGERKQFRTRKRLSVDTYVVKVSNIDFDVQPKNFKNEVRKLVTPSYVDWNRRQRSCNLYFNRKRVDTTENGGIDSIVNALKNLSIDVETAEGQTKTITNLGIKLLPSREEQQQQQQSVEIIPRNETVDSTTV